MLQVIKYTFYGLIILLLAGCSKQITAEQAKDLNYLVPKGYQQYTNSDYDISFQLPNDWSILSAKVSPAGFHKIYAPKKETDTKPQSFIVEFKRNKKSSFKEFIAEDQKLIATSLQKAKCPAPKIQIQKQQKDFIIFTLRENQCEKAPYLNYLGVYKVFRATDGLYILNYRVPITDNFTEQHVNEMQNIVENAYLVKRKANSHLSTEVIH